MSKVFPSTDSEYTPELISRTKERWELLEFYKEHGIIIHKDGKRTTYCKDPNRKLSFAKNKPGFNKPKHKKKNKHTPRLKKGELNMNIWDNVELFKKHWSCIKLFPHISRDKYPLDITDKQWMSLASYHGSIKKYGTKKIDAMIEKLTNQSASCIMSPDKESKKYWKKKAGK